MKKPLGSVGLGVVLPHGVPAGPCGHGLSFTVSLPRSELRRRYLSESVNSCQAAAVKSSVPPSRRALSRTRITPLPLAASTHCPPLLSL